MGANPASLLGSERAQRAQNFNPTSIQGDQPSWGGLGPLFFKGMNQDKVLRTTNSNPQQPLPFISILLYVYSISICYTVYTGNVYSLHATRELVRMCECT